MAYGKLCVNKAYDSEWWSKTRRFRFLDNRFRIVVQHNSSIGWPAKGRLLDLKN